MPDICAINLAVSCDNTCLKRIKKQCSLKLTQINQLKRQTKNRLKWESRGITLSLSEPEGMGQTVLIPLETNVKGFLRNTGTEPSREAIGPFVRKADY